MMSFNNMDTYQKRSVQDRKSPFKHKNTINTLNKSNLPNDYRPPNLDPVKAAPRAPHLIPTNKPVGLPVQKPAPHLNHHIKWPKSPEKARKITHPHSLGQNAHEKAIVSKGYSILNTLFGY